MRASGGTMTRLTSGDGFDTDKCYANREWEWGYREDEAMGGADPYSASKGASEVVTAAYRRSFGLRCGSSPNGSDAAPLR